MSSTQFSRSVVTKAIEHEDYLNLMMSKKRLYVLFWKIVLLILLKCGS